MHTQGIKITQKGHLGRYKNVQSPVTGSMCVFEIRKDWVLHPIHTHEAGLHEYVPLEGYGLIHNSLSFLRAGELLAINVNYSISPAQGDVMEQNDSLCEMNPLGKIPAFASVNS